MHKYSGSSPSDFNGSAATIALYTIALKLLSTTLRMAIVLSAGYVSIRLLRLGVCHLLPDIMPCLLLAVVVVFALSTMVGVPVSSSVAGCSAGLYKALGAAASLLAHFAMNLLIWVFTGKWPVSGSASKGGV